MTATFTKIVELVLDGKVRVSRHGYRRLVEHNIDPDELVASIGSAEVLEDYPEFHTGPSVLVLHVGAAGSAVHAVWGVEKRTEEPAVLITAYRPDPRLWSADFRRRNP